MTRITGPIRPRLTDDRALLVFLTVLAGAANQR